MGRLIAVLSVYNEASHIKHTLDTLCKLVDEIHIFDGVHPPFPQDGQPDSTDNTRAIVENYDCPDTPILWHVARRYKSQIDKRTATLQVGREGDYILIVDGDERVYGLENLQLGSFDVGWVQNFSPLYDKPYRSPRLFRWRPGLHYAGRHSWVYDRKHNLVSSHQHYTNQFVHLDLDVMVWNLREWNGPGRDTQKRKFRRQRNPLENSFRTENDVYKKHETLIPHPARAGQPSQCGWKSIKSKNTTVPQATMICPFSRPWAVERWFKHFETVDLPEASEKTLELLVIVDHNSEVMREHVKTCLARIAPRFHSVHFLFTGLAPASERGWAHVRRARIITNLRRFLCKARGHWLLGAEDDTLPDVDAYPRLMELFQSDPQIGFVQGTEVGRWDNPVIPHWTIRADKKGVWQDIVSASYEDRDVVPIHGGGWYLFISTTHIFRAIDLSWQEPIGPDVWCVWRIHLAGWKCFGIWSVNAVHFTSERELHPADGEIQTIRLKKTGAGRWNTKQMRAHYRTADGDRRMSNPVASGSKSKSEVAKRRERLRKEALVRKQEERKPLVHSNKNTITVTVSQPMAVCVALRPLKIGNRLVTPPPRGAPFETLDMIRARDLEARKKIRILHVEDYCGPWFPDSRLVTPRDQQSDEQPH